MTAEQDLRQAQQQMAAARPWDTAEHESLWSITGTYPPGQGSFTNCLAITLPHYVTGSDRPLFAFLPPMDGETVGPEWISRATPLLIVHRDEPTRAFWEQDQDLIEAAS